MKDQVELLDECVSEMKGAGMSFMVNELGKYYAAGKEGGTEVRIIDIGASYRKMRRDVMEEGNCNDLQTILQREGNPWARK